MLPFGYPYPRQTSRLWPWVAAYFVIAPPPPPFALTVQNGNPRKTTSWCREVLPVCPRCHRALADIGREGRVLKDTGERWYLGHTVGRHFDSPGANAMQEQAERVPERD